MGFFEKKKKPKEIDMFSANGLINFVKDNLKNPTEENILKAVQEIAKPDVDQKHLTKDGELPWGWYYLNKDFTDNIHNEYTSFLNAWMESEQREPKKQYETLKSLVLWLNDAKNLCYSKNECFAKWFSDNIADDEYIAKRQAELEELVKNFDSLDLEWKLRQREMENLDAKIEDLLKKHDGIIQSEFVKMFHEVIQSDVKEKLYYMDKEGKLQRTKQGRSYILHLK